jgi:hypothetical protein
MSGYPWSAGDALLASDLNAAFLPMSGGPTGASAQIGVSGNDYHGFNWVYARTRWYGQITGPDSNADNSIAANKFLWDDNADISGGNGTAAALYAQTVVQGSVVGTNTASRQAMHSHLVVQGQVGATPTLGPLVTSPDFVSQLSIAYAIAPQGGLGGWTAGNNPSTGYFRGSLFGGNDNAWLDTGASNYFWLVGREIDISIFGSATVYNRAGLLIVAKSDSVQALGDDAGILFEGGPFGNKNAIQFGATTGGLAVSDALIKVVSRLYPSPAASAYVTGLDFTQATFSGNALATPGFAVSGAGRVTATLTNAANDAAAASAGVPVGALYRNGNAVQVRLV